MATPAEKLAESLEILRHLQEEGRVAIRSSAISRTHRERLINNGFLKEVMKGWYISSRPDEAEWESTAWYASFWDFCSAYLNYRFQNDWCLTPEQSLLLYAENRTTPVQLLVRSPRASNNNTKLPYNTSLFDLKLKIPRKKDIQILNGLRIFSLPAALVACSPAFFAQYPIDARIALSMVKDASEVLSILLDEGKSTVAGRLVGAFRNIGRNKIADAILQTMSAADFDVREVDPFEAPSTIAFATQQQSPYATRIRQMWQEMRSRVIDAFPEAPGLPSDIHAYMEHVDEIYRTDAYHSLSIEGYRVNPELIERVRSGNWNPIGGERDREDRNALAARGYWQAFQSVRQSVEQILSRSPPGPTANEDHRKWYLELFGPSVSAGILKPADLAGYRNSQVYIRNSKHVPPRVEAVRDSMPILFELLSSEDEASVRVVLGHFIFVFIHPYMDGNGRMARFLMNLMLASGGYPWVVIPVEERVKYMKALEAASCDQDIGPFADFLARLTKSAST